MIDICEYMASKKVSNISEKYSEMLVTKVDTNSQIKINIYKKRISEPEMVQIRINFNEGCNANETKC